MQNYSEKKYNIFYSENTSVMLVYICSSHWNLIVIRSETNEKWILKGTTLLFQMKLRSQLHFFQGRISAIPKILVPSSGQGLKKVVFSTVLELFKISFDSE